MEDGYRSAFDDLASAGATPDPLGMAHEGPVIGTPATDTFFWDGQQQLDDGCAIKCQEFILEQFTGQEIDELALANYAQAQGWYTPGQGTPFEALGNILEANGIAVNRYVNATLYDLANELAQGHKVIIGVDSAELWFQTDGNGADHALVVSGIDTTTDPPGVVVHDPGTGSVARYPMEQLLAAWDDSNHFMVSTVEPAPPSLPEMVNFPYDQGHIPQVFNIPYDEFTQYAVREEDFLDILRHLFQHLFGIDHTHPYDHLVQPQVIFIPGLFDIPVQPGPGVPPGWANPPESPPSPVNTDSQDSPEPTSQHVETVVEAPPVVADPHVDVTVNVDVNVPTPSTDEAFYDDRTVTETVYDSLLDDDGSFTTDGEEPPEEYQDIPFADTSTNVPGAPDGYESPLDTDSFYGPEASVTDQYTDADLGYSEVPEAGSEVSVDPMDPYPDMSVGDVTLDAPGPADVVLDTHTDFNMDETAPNVDWDYGDAYDDYGGADGDLPDV